MKPRTLHNEALQTLSRLEESTRATWPAWMQAMRAYAEGERLHVDPAIYNFVTREREAP